MTRFLTLLLIITFMPALALRAQSQPAMSTELPDSTAATGDAKVLIHTDLGDITVLLYGDTPLHRDNFLKLAREGFYDGVLFHRVIPGFMVQTGDPDSRDAAEGQLLGMGNPGYTIEAEFRTPRRFHKRGALAAARESDATNPELRSSGSQFYIVTGRACTPSQLDQMEHSMQMARKKEIFNRLTAENRDTIMTLRRNRDTATLQQLQEELIKKAGQEADANPARFTDEQREIYTTYGGAPHLDGTYTVFGEVIDGYDIVRKIQRAQTDGNDRPLEDIRITGMTVIKPQ